VLPQSEESKILARYQVSPESDVIDPDSSKEIQVTLVTMKLNEINLQLHINIIGTNNGQPHLINLWANSIGPKVRVTPLEIDFGHVNVLQDYVRKVTITNDSKIPSDFHAFTKQKISIFRPIQKHAILKPDESIDI
jgi:hydrocephalus-inducing protein